MMDNNYYKEYRKLKGLYKLNMMHEEISCFLKLHRLSKAGIHQTGAIYDFIAPSKIVSKPPCQWNTMEIQTLGQSYTVIINRQEGNRIYRKQDDRRSYRTTST